MTYHVSMLYHTDHDFDDADECAEWIVDHCTDDDDVENYLNDCYDTVDICGLEYDAGTALRQIDEYAFGEAAGEWRGNEQNDIRYELERLDYGEEYEYSGTCGTATVEAVDECDDDGTDGDGIDEPDTPDAENTEKHGYVAEMHTAGGTMLFWFDSPTEAVSFADEYKALDPNATAYNAATNERITAAA
jgi:hypothetical protein